MIPPFCRPSFPPYRFGWCHQPLLFWGFRSAPRIIATDSQQLVGATSAARTGWYCYCWCSGRGLSDCCVSRWPRGLLPLSAAPHPFWSLSSLSASSSPSVGREMHGYSLEVWGVESWAPLKWRVTYPPASPQHPCLFEGTASPVPLRQQQPAFKSQPATVTVDVVLGFYHVVFFIANMLHSS